MTIDQSIFLSIAAITLSLLSTFLLMTTYQRKKRDSELDSIREYYESQLYKTIAKLTATETKWKDINHLLINGQTLNSPDLELKQPSYTDFLKNAGLSPADLVPEKNSVFVLTPFHSEMQPTYKTIQETCMQIGMRCYRGDEEHLPGEIFQHILKLLVRARVVIANIDGRNPNVLYELGIAHAIGKPTIILSKNLNDTPFDIKSKTIIIYSTEEELRKKLSQALAKILVQY